MDPPPDYGRGLARAAIRAGLEALERNAPSDALLFFERARRLAPNDPASLLLAASATSRLDPVRAIALLDTLIDRLPSHRDAHVLRAILLHKTGQIEAAANAVHHILSRFSAPLTDTFQQAASRIAQDAKCAGWVGVIGSGRAITHVHRCQATLDGKQLGVNDDDLAERELPASWLKASELAVTSRAGRVLGSPVDLASIRRVTGYVEHAPGVGLTGWALAPFDQDTPPAIDVFANDDSRPFASVVADDHSLVMEQGDGAQQALGFTVPAARLPPGSTWHVRTRDGTALAGSPIYAGAEALAAREHRLDPWRPISVTLAENLPTIKRRIPNRRALDVIVPLYRDADLAASCIASVRASCPADARIVAVDDGSPDPALRAWAERAHASGEIVLLRHATNKGFPSAVNTGLRHAAGRDVLLLNSDTALPPGAIQRLADAAYSAPDIGTVTPMTNDGSITTLATPGAADPMPDAATLAATNATIARANDGVLIDLPTCVGFCTFIRHDCLAETGLFREDAFAQGYGEENDFSCRAALLGWRHVAACDVIVAHAGGASFGAVRLSLMSRNLGIMERLHPGYLAMVTDFSTRDPLQPARHAYDRARWADARSKPGGIVLVTHDSGGGVERHVTERAAAIVAAGTRAIVVRPATGPDGETDGEPAIGYVVSDGPARTHPNLIFPDAQSLATFLRDDHPSAVELHHTASHKAGIERLAGLLRVPFDIVVHDYAAICPRVTLCGGTGAYCGLPADSRDCDDCIADNGARIPFAGSVGDLRATQSILFGAARRVVVPANDAALRLARIMPRLQPVVGAWEAGPPQSHCENTFRTRPRAHRARRRHRAGQGLRRAARLRAGRRKARPCLALHPRWPHA